MKTAFSLLTALFSAATSTGGAQATAPRPALVVLIAVDQFRGDYSVRVAGSLEHRDGARPFDEALGSRARPHRDRDELPCLKRSISSIRRLESAGMLPFGNLVVL